MNKKDMKDKFEKNVDFLKHNIPPDDIYLFAEQTFMATLFFLHKWSEWVDVAEECSRDPIARKWVTNIIGLQRCKEKNQDVSVDLNLNSIESHEDRD